jgi:hypothetical protein
MTFTLKVQIFFVLATISLCAIVSPDLISPPSSQEDDHKTMDWNKPDWATGNQTDFPMRGHGWKGNFTGGNGEDNGEGKHHHHGNHTGFG